MDKFSNSLASKPTLGQSGIYAGGPGVVPKSSSETEGVNKSPWIQAWSDSVAGIKTLSQCMVLSDLENDGDYKMIIADHNSRLKIYKGTNVFLEAKLLSLPVACVVFHATLQNELKPIIACGCGNAILMFKDYQQFYRLTMPDIKGNDQEIDVWNKLISKQVNYEEATSLFQGLSSNRVEISLMANEFLGLDSAEEQEAFISNFDMGQLSLPNYVTCLATLNEKSDESKSASLLVVGTESKFIYIYQSTGTAILKQIILESIPVFMYTSGQLDSEYKIIIAARDGKIYQIKNGEKVNVLFELESKPVAIAPLNKSIAIACMDKSIHAYFSKGKKAFSIFFPDTIVTMIPVQMQHTHNIKGLLVGLNNGEVRLYNDRTLIHIIRNDEIVNGVCFGNYGREEGTLVQNFKSGGISVKMLQRQAKLNTSSVKVGPPSEQDIPLNVPKKSRLFIDLTTREREQAVTMHRTFQTELAKLRLRTAQEYFTMINEGHAPMSYSTGSEIRINAIVQGLGPYFKLKLIVRNIGKKSLIDLPVVVAYNQLLYKLLSPNITIAVLIPGIEYTKFINIESIEPTGAADVVRISIYNKHNVLPLITAFINMPIAEPNFENY